MGGIRGEIVKKPIHVGYKESADLLQKTNDELANEAQDLYVQAETIASVSVMMVAAAGQRLRIIKERLGHGNWLPWAKENLNFSERKMNLMMNLAEKIDDGESIFSNPQALSDIGISKVWALLAAPEEVAAEVIESGDAEDMTVRELQEQIKTLKEENEQISAALEDAKSKGASEKELNSLKKKLEYEKGQNTILKEKSEKDIEKAVEKAKKEAEKNIKQEVAKATADMEEELKGLQAENTKLQLQSNEDLTEFRVQTKVMQECCNDCMTVIARVSAKDKDKAKKMAEGLKKILEAKITNVDELTKDL